MNPLVRFSRKIYRNQRRRGELEPALRHVRSEHCRTEKEHLFPPSMSYTPRIYFRVSWRDT